MLIMVIFCAKFMLHNCCSIMKSHRTFTNFYSALCRSTVESYLIRSLSPYSQTYNDSIPSPTHSFTLGLNPSFSANPLYRSLSFFSFRIHYVDFPDCLLLLLSISVFLLFSFFLFLHFFSCRFRAVD